MPRKNFEQIFQLKLKHFLQIWQKEYESFLPENCLMHAENGVHCYLHKNVSESAIFQSMKRTFLLSSIWKGTNRQANWDMTIYWWWNAYLKKRYNNICDYHFWPEECHFRWKVEIVLAPCIHISLVVFVFGWNCFQRTQMPLAFVSLEQDSNRRII